MNDVFIGTNLAIAWVFEYVIYGEVKLITSHV